MNLEDLSLADAAAGIRSGELSPVDYVSHLLDRIDAIEPRLQAWVTIDRKTVLSQASELEIEAKKQQFRGPLHGIPVGIKDIFYTKGLRTTMGSVLFEDFVPEGLYEVVVSREFSSLFQISAYTSARQRRKAARTSFSR